MVVSIFSEATPGESAIDFYDNVLCVNANYTPFYHCIRQEPELKDWSLWMEVSLPALVTLFGLLGKFSRLSIQENNFSFSGKKG